MSPRTALPLLLLASSGCLPEDEEATTSDHQDQPPSAVDVAAPDVDSPEQPDTPSDPEAPSPAVVVASPAALDLGMLDPRCLQGLEVILTASGEEAAGAFSVTAPEGWTVTPDAAELAPGASTTLLLDWEGSAADPSGEISVAFEAIGPLIVPVRATPQVPTERLTIDLEDRAEADLLLAVDRSCNMDDMARLEPHWPTLRSRLSEAGIALRMTSVVADDACVLGDVLVLDESLDDDAFRDALWAQQDWRGDWGTYTERLLDLSSRALVARCNDGFVQGSAPLHVLAFSDEPDQSEEDWSVYVEQMKTLPDPGVPLTVHGIGATATSECNAQYYQGVIEAAADTRGVFLDFCTEDWHAGLTTLADGMAAASRRVVLPTLTHQEGAPVAVFAAGLEVQDWIWDGESTLDLPADLALTDEVAVEYQLMPACD
ncbi:MAG: hypothetical protein CL927_15770 [Deltaproteobacteria bacterium]|nr:hypothetical protein [Deltaproteobacteria bacterium]